MISFEKIELGTLVSGPELDWFSLKNIITNEYYNFRNINGARTSDVQNDQYGDKYIVSGSAKLMSPGYYDVTNVTFFKKK